ncbi:MAG: hypothetical protein L3J15_08015 [Devosiaceae bacterium]|nr:hypothetical protein [Devosiaceae bacterium]
MIIAMLLGSYGHHFSWIIGGILIVLILAVSLLINGISLQYFILASLSIFGYNAGLMLALTFKIIPRYNNPSKI